MLIAREHRARFRTLRAIRSNQRAQEAPHGPRPFSVPPDAGLILPSCIILEYVDD